MASSVSLAALPDRLPSNKLTMTQELIANMLGVRRERVTESAGRLQKLVVISYTRGQITVLDLPRLETLCCECGAAQNSSQRNQIIAIYVRNQTSECDSS